MTQGIRLQKWIAASGLMSRRKAEEAIQAGRIRVNGEVVQELGTRIDPRSDRIELDGRRVVPPLVRRVYAFNKPRRVITSKFDPEGRRTVMNFFPPELQRLFPVGRLDYQSEGLLLLTDDGDLANRLTHPSHGVLKEYRVWLEKEPDPADLEKLKNGVDLEDGVGRFESVRRATGNPQLLNVVVSEGRNRFIRRMCAALGYPVTRLQRVRIGGLELGKLKPGESRELSPDEISGLLDGGSTES